MKIVIIGASELQNPLILKAKELGFETHVFAWECGDIGDRDGGIDGERKRGIGDVQVRQYLACTKILSAGCWGLEIEGIPLDAVDSGCDLIECLAGYEIRLILIVMFFHYIPSALKFPSS